MKRKHRVAVYNALGLLRLFGAELTFKVLFDFLVVFVQGVQVSVTVNAITIEVCMYDILYAEWLCITRT